MLSSNGKVGVERGRTETVEHRTRVDKLLTGKDFAVVFYEGMMTIDRADRGLKGSHAFIIQKKKIPMMVNPISEKEF